MKDYYCRNCHEVFDRPDREEGYIGCDMDGNRGYYSDSGYICPYCGSSHIKRYLDMNDMIDDLISELRETYEDDELCEKLARLITE